jgi:hypothetical protein
MESHDIAFWINQVLMQAQIEKGGTYSITSNYSEGGVPGNVRMDIQAGEKKFRILIFESIDS